MKKVLTLTKTIGLAALILVFAAASAANLKDDTSKCKKHCCKDKQLKEMQQAINEMKASPENMTVEVKAFDAATLKTQIAQAVAVAPVKFVRGGRIVVLLKSVEPELSLAETSDFEQKNSEMDKVQEDMSRLDAEEPAKADQKIDFNNLNMEMNNVQENLSQMDPTLKNDDTKTQKKAETILKTGIKS